MSLRGLILFAVLAVTESFGQVAPNPAPDASRDRNEARFQQLQQELRERDAIIRNLLERVQDLEKRVGVSSLNPRPPESVGASAVEATAPNNAVAASAPAPSQESYDEEDRKARAVLDRALIQRGGLLLPSGKMEIESMASFYDASTDQVSVQGFSILPVLVVGNIVSDRVRREVALSTIATRMGLPWNLQLDTQTPYGYETVNTVTASNTGSSEHSVGLGDIQIGLTKQLAKEHDGVPDLLAGITFKTKTGKDPFQLGNDEIALGTGFYGLQGRVTAVKSSDPMIFFGSLAYTHNFPIDQSVPDPTTAGQNILARVEPGDSAGFQIGSILAVNPEASISVAWDQSFTRGTTVNDVAIPGTYLIGGTLRLGTTYVYAPGRNIDLNIGIGVTRDVPNLQFTLGFPFRFNLWKQPASK